MRDSPFALARQLFGYGRGRALTVWRHPGSLRPRHLAAPAMVLCLALLSALGLRYAVALRLVLAALAAYVAALAISTVAGFRRGGAPALYLPVAFPIMHVAWALGFWVELGRLMVGGRAEARRGLARRAA
jgi:succinoglycan biosynthesis protein ExoA